MGLNEKVRFYVLVVPGLMGMGTLSFCILPTAAHSSFIYIV